MYFWIFTMAIPCFMRLTMVLPWLFCIYTMGLPCFWRFNMVFAMALDIYYGNTMFWEIYVGTTMAFWIYNKAVPCFRRFTMVAPMVFDNILGYDNTMFWIHTMEIPYFIYRRLLDIYYNNTIIWRFTMVFLTPSLNKVLCTIPQFWAWYYENAMVFGHVPQ